MSIILHKFLSKPLVNYCGKFEANISYGLLTIYFFSTRSEMSDVSPPGGICWTRRREMLNIYVIEWTDIFSYLSVRVI